MIKLTNILKEIEIRIPIPKYISLEDFKKHQDNNSLVYRRKIKDVVQNIKDKGLNPDDLIFGDYQPEGVEKFFGRLLKKGDFDRNKWINDIHKQLTNDL